MRRLTNIFVLFLISTTVFGQIKRKDILGEWQTQNDDSLYYHSDTIKLYQDINHFYNTETCYLIRWTIDKRNYKLSNVFICTEPGRISSFTDKEKLRLTKTDFGQIITLERNNQIFDKFKITDYQEKEIDRYPHDTKKLQLMRFDNLSDYKLFYYVDSLIYKVLEYDSTKTDTIYPSIGGNNENIKIKLRDGFDPNPEPLIVINGYIVENKEILRRFRFVETIEIRCLKKDDLKFIYGTRALNGVIVISLSKKRFKQEWKNYGR